MGERQIIGADLQKLALGAQPGHPQRRLIPARHGQPRTGRHMVGQHRHRGPALGVAQRMHVIQDQRHRGSHRRESRSQPWGDRARHRTRRRRQRIKHPLIDWLHRIQRRGDVAEQDLRVVVRLIDRHPGKRLTVALGPLRQQRRFPIPRRRDHRHDRAGIAASQPLDQQRPAHHPWSRQRTAQLRGEKVERRTICAARSASPLTHSANHHAPDDAPTQICRCHGLPQPQPGVKLRAGPP